MLQFVKILNPESVLRSSILPLILLSVVGCSTQTLKEQPSQVAKVNVTDTKVVNDKTSSNNVATFTYKEVAGKPLKLEVHTPKNISQGQKVPAIVFFFGGGWNGGKITQFKPQSEYFTEQGLVTILVDYRVKSRNKTTPADAVSDAKSAMRWVRTNATRLNIDANNIIASGGSAGGHLAAATAFISDFNDPTDDLSVSPKPQALILFNPVIDNGPKGYGYARVNKYWQRFSPLHNITSEGPPTLTMLGTRDDLIPVATGQAFDQALTAQGGISELRLYEGQKHGFFNKARYKETLKESHNFLFKLGYLTEAYID
ncbi:alpha/beta hydrolase [Paraglaciecola sp. L3A3]|uniref:alpha/beta hydrolase n=1 Tax=Paraglaciecola sp. L3A3 TaxID=2686358 RepID=UPI00131CE13E|nr:alpha/beta hydrolase [Paraglaciecola sp. L3A3]